MPQKNNNNVTLEKIKKIFLQSTQPSAFFRNLQDSGELLKLFPEIAELADIQGALPYHPEGSVFEHTMQALDASTEIKNVDDGEKFMLMLATNMISQGFPYQKSSYNVLLKTKC